LHTLDHGVIDHLAAAAVRRQRLGEEHRQQGLRRRQQPLTVPRQQRFDPIKQLRAGEQIEHGVEIRAADTVLDTLLLPAAWAMARIHLGWILGWLL
jgi:hypothetical protein